MTYLLRTIFLPIAWSLALATAFAQAQEQFQAPEQRQAQNLEQELARLPTALSAERLDAIALLVPSAEMGPRGMPLSSARTTIETFRRQAVWPIRIKYKDSSQYWGEVTRINTTTFELWNRQANQTITLDYAGMREVELVEAHGAAGNYSQRRSSAPNVPEPVLPLTAEELTYQRAAEHIALFDRRFVRCELKDHSVVTGEIVYVGAQDFIVRPGKLHEDRVIRYSDLVGPLRPTAAVGAHFRNALEMTGLVAFCAVLLPVCVPDCH